MSRLAKCRNFASVLLLTFKGNWMCGLWAAGCWMWTVGSSDDPSKDNTI